MGTQVGWLPKQGLDALIVHLLEREKFVNLKGDGYDQATTPQKLGWLLS
jgi:hypothetical protein